MTEEYALHLLNQLMIGASVDAKPVIPQYELAQALNVVIKALEQKPCKDCISREEVQDLISRWLSDYLLDETREALETINYKVGDMPSVIPQRPKGKWIKIQSGDDDFPESIVCSRCKNENSHLDFDEHNNVIGKVFVTSKYCPNCGAEMEVEDEISN